MLFMCIFLYSKYQKLTILRFLNMKIGHRILFCLKAIFTTQHFRVKFMKCVGIELKIYFCTRIIIVLKM